MNPQRKIRFTMVAVLLCGCSLLFAQTPPSDPNSAVYAHAVSYGFGLHTRGARMFLDYTQGSSPKKWQVGVELMTLKGSKEGRTKTPFIELPEGSRVILDKINRFMTVTPYVGFQKTLFPRTYYNKVGVGAGFQTGFAVGFLRPYYLFIATPDPQQVGAQLVEEVAYNPDNHPYNVLIGEVQPWKNFTATQTHIGWGVHAYSHINLSRSMKSIRGIQLDVDAKIFPKKIPILHTTPNTSYFLTVGISFLQGHKW